MKIIRRNVFRFEMGHDGCTINENVKTDSKFVQHFSVKKEEKNKLIYATRASSIDKHG